MMIIKLMAWMPGPILYGAAIDTTCLYWTFPPCSKTGYCRVNLSKYIVKKIHSKELQLHFLTLDLRQECLSDDVFFHFNIG